MSHDQPATSTRFTRAAHALLGYTVLVIVFGAWVRISGSGAGCGQHWPTCHGEIAHRPQSIETVIELTHRATSGLCMLAMFGLVIWGWRSFPRRHPVRPAVMLAGFFMITEALLGAGLVLLELVGRNDSVSRAIMMAVHLSNTSLLTGVMAYVAWASSDERRVRIRTSGARWLLIAGLISLVVLSMSGAVTALGDTLYPLADDGTILEHLNADQSITAHFLQKLRVIHPILAIVVGLYLLWLAISLPQMPDNPKLRTIGNVVAGLVVAQLCAGVVNIMLSAPGWMQLVHLALATCLWIACVLLTLTATHE